MLRLELTAAHKTSKLAGNLNCSLSKFNITEVYAWSDSTITLDWLKGNREYKVFVCNRVAKINEKGFRNTKYVPAKHNLADLGSRGCDVGKLGQNWWESPMWL